MTMEIIKTYKFKLKLTKSQEQTINNWIGTCRYLYNTAKEVKEEGYRLTGRSATYYDLCKEMTAVRKEFDWVKEVPSGSCQDVLERLEKAYNNFFSKRTGYPKWAKKGKYNSITFKLVKIDTHNRVKLPKVGRLKYFASQELKGDLRRATITKESDGHYICITTKQEINPIKVSSENQVGIDMGISYFAVTSGGEYVNNPRFLEKSLKQLRVEQRSLSRKKKGSNNRAKQRLRVAKLHQRISRQRKDFLHKTSSRLVQENSLIVVEDLNIADMVRSNLAIHISDVSWGEFHYQLGYKSEWYASEFKKVNPAYSSQECSQCGHIAKENRLTQSQFKCVSCAHSENADVNAGKVILRRGTSDVTEREAIA